MTSPLLQVHNLTTRFRTDAGVYTAVDGISFSLAAGEVLGLVGESGCGKSVTSLSVMRLIPPTGEIAAHSEVRFRDRELLALPESAMRQIRGNDIAMIFQEPMTSLNPVFTVGDQIEEAVRFHRRVGKAEARARAIDMLRLVGMPDPAERADSYPHQLSGGQRQRVMIAIALSCEPDLLIADEPTTALDVTIQAQILELLARLKEQLGMAMILITHDLGVVAEVCHRVAVMYAGRIVEEGTVGQIFRDPRHPYTQGLLRAIPRLGQRRHKLDVIPGSVPAPGERPSGCRFRTRCPFAWESCLEEPDLLEAGGGHTDRCWLEEYPERRREPHAQRV
jgi:oligopeptide/dipeptide ABC transporter ATP-binding protein